MLRILWRLLFDAGAREARNEQKKLLAAYINALAIALFIGAFAGPILNPALTETLTGWDRLGIGAVSIIFHLAARAILGALEDR